MNNSLFMLNQLLWLVLAVMTLGLVALAWKRPVNELSLPLVEPQVSAEPVSAASESTLMIVHVRKFHAQNQQVLH